MAEKSEDVHVPDEYVKEEEKSKEKKIIRNNDRQRDHRHDDRHHGRQHRGGRYHGQRYYNDRYHGRWYPSNQRYHNDGYRGYRYPSNQKHEQNDWHHHGQRYYGGKQHHHRNKQQAKDNRQKTKADDEHVQAEEIMGEDFIPTPDTTPTTTSDTTIERVQLVHGNNKMDNSQRGRRKNQHSKGRVKHKEVVPSVQSDELCQQLLGGSYECMVCCDKLRGHREVWSCPCCYHIFHLNCISRWSKSPAAAANEEHPEDGWRCPACQATSTVIPSVYKCFCGKVTNPNKSRKRNDLTVPHTCGEPCRKRLAPSDDSFCPHKCPQLCHPGPCPPCPIVVTRKCPCGKSSSRVRCSQMNLLPSCGQKCLKTLNCGVHKCNDVCHEGPCDSCTVSIPIKCHCQREVKQVLCGQSNEEYSCGRLCNKPLGCGNHTCESDCHPGPCSLCQLLPSTVTHCPCGATPISKLLPLGVNRTSCLDDIPLCDNICSKPLPCSAYSDNVENHTCNSRCHLGVCPPCTLTTVIYCGCGQSSEKVSCSKVREREGFTCNRKCGKKLSCGRHQCQIKCCMSESHHCERICGRKHECGKHTCKEPCHSWRCGPCWNISYDELTCHCGGEVMLPPIPCGTTPPPCTRLCARTHPCDHPVTHPCHSDDFPCPPCTFLTDKMCMGGHLMRNYIPCHLKDVSCGKPCARPLPCGMHSCCRLCHKGDCQMDEGNPSCTQPCTIPRKYCSHPCGAPCHYGNPCPDQPCKAKVILTCECGRRSEQVMCLSSSATIASQTFHKMHSGDLDSIMRGIQSGQSIRIDNFAMKSALYRSLECDEICAQMARNRVLAEALELTDVDHSPDTVPQYSTFLLEQVRDNQQLVANIENIFKDIIEGNGGKTSHSFKPMKRDHRRIIHELAEYYNLTSTSYDPEPQRNVVVIATKKSSIPCVTLTEHVSTSKHRPIPLPVTLRPDNTAPPDYFNDDDIIIT